MLHTNSILGLAIIFLGGFVGAKLLRRVYFPAVTAYLLVGIMIGPHALNLVPPSILHFSDVLSDFVLGVIAFSLGANFVIRSTGSKSSAVWWISVLEACGAWFMVTVVMIGYATWQGMPLHPALVLGAAAAATAPAATVMVIREYRARGPVTDTLLRVVAIDDTWCLIISALAISVATSLHTGSFNATIILRAFLEIGCSLAIGIVLAFSLYYGSRFLRTKEEILTVILGFIMIAVGLSKVIHLSLLLTTMAAGITIANMSEKSTVFFDVLNSIDTVLFLCFFIMVGANLEISILPNIGLIGILYIVFRVVGKFIGVNLGAWISHAGKNIKRYLAWGLVPQAGVALGVAMSAKSLYPHYGTMIFTTITATTVIYELVGPFCTKYGLKKAEEIG